MKVLFDFNLNAWIKGIEIDADSYEDALAKLHGMPFEELVEHYETAAKTLAFCFETLEVCNARIIAADELIKKYKEDNEEFFDE